MYKKRIAIISARFPPNELGGISAAHYNLYTMLKRSEFYDVISCNFGDRLKSNKKEGIYRFSTPHLFVKVLNFINKIYFRFNDKGKTAYQLVDILKNTIGSLKINLVLHRYKPDYIILPDQGCPGLFILKNKNSKLILISHHNPVRFLNNPIIGSHSHADAALALRLENFSLKKVDMVICPSHYMKEVFENTHSYQKQIAVIPNIVNLGLIKSIPARDIRESLGLKKGSIVIYIPSAGSRIKGSKYVFEIIRRVANSTTEKIGIFLSGSINDELRYELNYIPENAKVYTPGFLSYHENISVIKSCSFCISPTLLESFGMAVLEANACNMPVATFNIGGIQDVIVHTKNGFLATYMDFDKLINYSIKLLNRNECSRMKKNCYSFISKKFNSSSIMEKLMIELSQL